MEWGVDGTGTAGGNRMQTMMDSGAVATVTPSGRREAAPLRLTTTLYELMAALQAVVALDDDALVVAIVAHLLQFRRLTWLRTDSMLECPSRRQMMPPQPRGTPRPPRRALRAPCIPIPAAQKGWTGTHPT
jgi:hypothetical protein